MKKSLMLLLAVAAFSVFALGQGNPRGKADATVQGKTVSVDYGRPSLKGRDMLAQAPVGTVWRMGADKSTTFTTEADLQFGDVTIPQGAYSLFAKHAAADRWELVFNKQVGQWGTQHDPGQDFASVPLSREKSDASVEMFTIEINAAGDGGTFQMMWGESVLKAPFTVK